MNETWNDFDKLMADAKAEKGCFFYLSYGHPVIIRGRALASLRKGKSLYIIGTKFLHKETLGFRYYA